MLIQTGNTWVKAGRLAAALAVVLIGGCASQSQHYTDLMTRDALSAESEAQALNEMSLAAADALGRQIFVEGAAQAGIFRKAGEAFAAAERADRLHNGAPGLPTGGLPETGIANVPTTPKD